mgnify:FL=1
MSSQNASRSVNSAQYRARKAERKRQIKRARRIALCVVLVAILIPVIICLVRGHKIKTLNKQVNTLEKQIKETESRNNQLQDQLDEQNQKLEELEQKAKEQAKAVIDDPDKPNAYLTFDDGPSKNTDIILDTLAKYNVKATFFTVVHEGEENAARYKRIVAEGHTIGLHSGSHNYSKLYASLDAFKKDVQQISDYVYKVTGVRSRYYRFPGGSSNQLSVRKVDIQECIKYLTDSGYIYYDWNAENGDAKGIRYTPGQLVNNMINNVTQCSGDVVILCHDEGTKTSTAKSVGRMIKALKSLGYDILPITKDTTPVQHVTLTN